MNRVPKLRFKEFCGEWEEKKLENIGENIIGLTYSPNDVVEDDGTLVLRSSNIKENRICLKDKVVVNLKINEKLLTKENDILICVRNGSQNLIGKNAIITKENENLTFGAFMTIFRSSYNKFVHQLFQTESYKMQILKNLGARINQITNKNLNSFVFYFAKLEEQEKIADFLSNVDKKIAITEEKLDLFKDYKKGIMQKIFNQKLKFKDSNGNDYPEWEEKRLGDINDVRDGTHDSPKYLTTGYPLVTSKNVQNGKIDLENVNYISLEDFNAINKRSKVSKGDILMGMIGTIGNLAIVEREDFAIKNVALIKEKEKLLNKFLYQLLQSEVFYKKLVLLNEGGTQKFISLNNIRNLYFNIPSLEEQQKIADFLSSIDKKIDNLAAELENLKEFKKGLLQQMFV